MEDSIETMCKTLRANIQTMKAQVVVLLGCGEFDKEDVPLDGANIPSSRKGNMAANITLAFRCLEDARMRLGKVMQAFQGGISIFDKKTGK